jgi:hypothetical protein
MEKTWLGLVWLPQTQNCTVCLRLFCKRHTAKSLKYFTYFASIQKENYILLLKILNKLSRSRIA